MHSHEIVKFLRYMSNCFLPCIFWTMIIFSFDTVYVAVLTILTAGIHELGHIAALLFLKGKAHLPSGRLYGFRIKTSGMMSYRDEICVLLAGPMANILAFFCLMPFAAHNRYAEVFSILNLATALSNLIPADGYDGYCALCKLFAFYGKSTRPLERISLSVSIILCFLSLYFIWEYAAGYWIFCVFFSSLLSKISKSVKSDIFQGN